MMKFLLIASGVSAYEKDYDYTPNQSGYAPAFRGQSYSKSSSYSSSSSSYVDSNGNREVSKQEQGEEQESMAQWGANYQHVVEQKKAWGKKLQIAETPTEKKESLQEYKKLAKKEQSLVQSPYGGILFKDSEQKAAYEKSLQQVQTWNPDTGVSTQAVEKHIQQQEEASQKTIEQLNTPQVQKTATVFDAMKKEMSHSEYGQFVNGINFNQGVEGVTNEMKEQAIHAENNQITTPYSSSVNKVYQQMNKQSKQETGKSFWSNLMGSGNSFFDNKSSSSNFLSKNFSQNTWGKFPSFKMPSFKMPSFSTQGHGYQQQGY
jgi:hypothetical protein